jgi:hypothetical protein
MAAGTRLLLVALFFSQHRSTGAAARSTPGSEATMSEHDFDVILGNLAKTTQQWKSRIVYYQGHRRRFVHTMRALEPYLRPNMVVLDVGGKGELMQSLFDFYQKGITVESHIGDIRYQWRTGRSGYDLILCMEVLEHLKDRPIRGISQLDLAIGFHYIGLWNYFIEARNILNDRGIMAITTPNANSYVALYKWMLGGPPTQYYLHGDRCCVWVAHDSPGL